MLEKYYIHLWGWFRVSTSEADVEAGLSHLRFSTTPCFLAREGHKIHGHAVINLLYSANSHSSAPPPRQYNISQFPTQNLETPPPPHTTNMTILSTLLSYLTANPSPLRLPQTSLHLSQQAPIFLASPESSKDTQETWLVYEQLLLSCLRTGDDTSARLCLQRLSDRFGADSPRISALAGLYDEATAQDRGELEKVCSRYEDMLKEDPTNMVSHAHTPSSPCRLGTAVCAPRLTQLPPTSP